MSNTILKASAGAGKTYKLSNRFLEILFAEPSVDGESPVGKVLDTILASTFTCMAAGEITDKIFKKFAAIVLDPEVRDRMLEKNEIRFPETDDLVPELRNRLAQLARNMYRLRVGTLHSYFSKVASVFSLELDLPPGWGIVDEKSEEYDHFLHEAVREVLEDSESNRTMEHLSLLQKGKEPASIAVALVEFAKKNLSLVEETRPEAWQHASTERLGSLILDELPEKKLDKIIAKFLDALDAAGEIETMLGYRDIGNRNVGYFCNGYENVVDCVRKRDWDGFCNNTLAQKVIPTLADREAPCVYTATKIDLKKESPVLFDCIRTLLPHARSRILRSIIEGNDAIYQILHTIAEKLEATLVRERKFRYDDITRRVGRYDFHDRLDSLNHRLDAHTKHLLLDEFQDTSSSQWEIIEPIAQRVAADGNGVFFCVGDVKQSIYGWRGGCAKIFETITNKLRGDKYDIIETSMQESWRSTQAVIDTVNELFETIEENKIVLEASGPAARDWQSRFEKHSTVIGSPGYCTLEEAFDEAEEPAEQDAEQNGPERDEPEEKSPGDVYLDYVVKRILDMNDILKTRPDLKKGIGVLVFTHKTAEKIVAELKDRGVEVNGRGQSLHGSFAVQHILSLLKLADHPGDTASLFHLAHGPLAAMLERKPDKAPDPDQAASDDGASEAAEKPKDRYFAASGLSRSIRYDLLSNGYGETIKKYVEILTPSCDAREFQCLEKLLELAYRFDEAATGIRTEKFAALVKETNLSNPNATSIQVMTVFGAKGLEFDMVVLPELDRNIKGFPSKFIVGHKTPDDATTPISLVLKNPGEKIRTFLPNEYLRAADHQLQAEVEESLSELYVAMTRAIHQLVMIVPALPKPKPGKKKSSSSTKTTFAETLRRGLTEKGDQPPAAGTIYSHGNPLWFKVKKKGKTSAGKKKDFKAVIRKLDCSVKSGETPHHVPRIAPSSLHKSAVGSKKTAKTDGQPKIQLVSTTSVEPRWTEGRALLWGTCMHACFEHAVEWLDAPEGKEPELLCGDGELREILNEILRFKKVSISPDEVIAAFHKNRRQRPIIEALSTTRYSGPKPPEIQRERRFIVWTGKGEIMRGSIDRLVIRRDDSNKVVGIEVLDYKSDTGDAEALAENYRGQLDAYRDAVATLFSVDPSIVKTTLVFVTTGKVVEL